MSYDVGTTAAAAPTSAAAAAPAPSLEASASSKKKRHGVGDDIACLDDLSDVPVAPFGISVRQIVKMTEDKDNAVLSSLGGPTGLAARLCTPPDSGPALVPASVATAPSIEARRAAFGANKFKEVASRSFLRLFFESLKDPILVLLMAAALVSTVLGAAIPEERDQAAWSEGIAIWVAVLVVSLVSSVNDYQKDLQFRKLNAQKERVMIKVLRGGVDMLVLNTELVVGDVVRLITGDKVAADGVVLASQGLVIDEASLTGESDPIKKSSEKDPWVRCGTQVSEGSGSMLVTAVGVHSEWGRTMALVVGEAGDTPLQQALTVLAQAVGKVGLGVGVVCFVVLLIRWCVENRGFPLAQFAEGPLRFFIFAVTIVVVAVPEGLPLAVTISLAYSMRKMMKDNNFVRVLAACETMGGATAICSDKTGTLTENRMTVVAAKLGGAVAPLERPPPQARGLVAGGDETLVSDLELNCALNSKAFLIEKEPEAAKLPGGGKKAAAAAAAAAADGSTSAGPTIEFVGNRTECALLMMLRAWGPQSDYRALRAQHAPRVLREYDFSSLRKMASVLVAPAGKTDASAGARLYVKGAAEMVVSRCVSTYVPSSSSSSSSPSSSVAPLDDAGRARLIDEVTEMAATGLRTIALAQRDLSAASLAGGAPEEPPEEQLMLVGIVGIKDPVRKEVPDAVATCQRAGIMVRMVTGDNIHTAKHIAKECGILHEGGLAMEGPDFRARSEEELMELLPRLQVLARSSPADKLVLVRTLKKMGDIVAVTGDGTNDAPALKESDVGMAMGIAGTEVSKEAADIVIMDDNFSSIVKAVMWGRSVFSSIRKFLQFQLTINFVALVVAFVAAVTSGETPLNVMQLLWVNLIMDSLAALALATEDPTPKLLLERPHGRTEPLISRRMWKHILTQGLYQMFWLFLIVYGGPALLPRYALPSPALTYSAVDAGAAGGRAKFAPIFDALPAGVSPDPRFGPLPPYPLELEKAHAACTKGPCVNACCTTAERGGTCLDNLVADGGVYLPGEFPLCEVWGQDEQARPLAALNKARDPKVAQAFCGGSSSSCPRQKAFKDLQVQADKQFHRHLQKGRELYSSIVFNAFIFMQLFNEINSRKIDDELNVFDKIWKSSGFVWVLVVSVGCQLIIMFTPVRNFFKVEQQNGAEWAFAVGVGAGSLLMALVVKLLSRFFSDFVLPTVVLGARRGDEGSGSGGGSSGNGGDSLPVTCPSSDSSFAHYVRQHQPPPPQQQLQAPAPAPLLLRAKHKSIARAASSSAFNACTGRGKHPELAEEEAAAKGDVELAGGNNGFVTPSAATAAAAPASLPTSSSSAKA